MINGNSLLSTLSMLKSGNAESIYQQMLNNNPQFKQFVENNKGKSPSDIAKAYGIDMNALRNLMK